MGSTHPKGVWGSYQSWRQDWFTGPQSDQLREKYRHDIYAYLNAWQPSEEDRRSTEEYLLCEGMEYFKKLEERMLRQARERPHRLRGQAALTRLMTALTDTGSRQRPTDDTDFVFVAIDFEGTTQQDRRINEFGAAKLDTRFLFPDDAEPLCIETSHFAFAKHRTRKFRFGETLRTDQTQLRKTVLDTLNITDNEHSGPGNYSMRKILLVGHGISSEISFLDKLGLPIEAFPQITGIVDTLYLSDSAPHLDCASLKRLLHCLHIPIGEHSLHCAGNDANYTLRALLAYLNKSCSGNAEVRRNDRLEELVKQTVPDAPSWSRPANDNWDDFDGLAALMA